MLSERDLQIIEYCVSKKDFVTSDELASHLSVSSRTIKSDLSKIEKNSEQIGIRIEMARGLGILIEIADINKFNKNMNQQVNAHDFNIQANRLIYIIQKFINDNSCVSEEELLSELYISRTLLLEDIEIVKDLFLEEGVHLKRFRNKGWRAEGNEAQFRKLLSKYIELDIDFLDSYNMYLANSKLSFEEISTLKIVVIDILHRHNKQAYGINITNLIIHILILVNRIRSGNSLKMFHIDSNIDIGNEEMELVQEIVEIVESLYRLQLSEAEIAYLYCCMVGKYNEVDDRKDPIITSFLSETFDEIQEIFGITIKDESFIDAIYAHTQSLITRLKINVKLESDIDILIDEFVLPNECALIYKNKFKKHFDLEIDETELYYITIHFGAYLEKIRRIRSKRYILLVSDERLSVSMFIKNKINTELQDDAEIELIVQSHELSTLDLKKFDYIISTENISSVCDNFLLIDKAATMLTIRQVQEYVKDNQTLYSFFKKDLFYTQVETEKMETLIIEAAKDFKEKDYIDDIEEFYKEVLNREQYQSTRLNHGIAIPHPLRPLSSKSFVSTIIPKHPIKWTNDKEAKLIFLISLGQVKDKSEVNVIFDILSKIASNENLINESIKAETYEEFMKIIIEN